MCKKLILIGHNNLGKAIYDTCLTLGADVKNIDYVNFDNSTPPSVLKSELETKIKNLNSIFIIVDFIGGTPFNVSMELKNKHKDKNIKIITSLNVPLVLELGFSLALKNELNLEQIIEKIKNLIKVF